MGSVMLMQFFCTFAGTDDSSRIVVEVQRRKQATFQVRNQVEVGSEDYAFCPVYVINILNFNTDENRGNPEVKTIYRLKKTLEELDDNILEGMYFCLKNMASLKACPEVLTHEVFRKMFDISELINMDESTRSKVLLKMTTERDSRNQMAYARQEA